MTSLQVYDAVVAGLAVILNKHTRHHPLVLRRRRQRALAREPGGQLAVDGPPLRRRSAGGRRRPLQRGPPRRVGRPELGRGDDRDWFAASQHLGDPILREANPNLLIIVEGINGTGVPIDGFATAAPR
jgi:hypothetical protein